MSYLFIDRISRLEAGKQIIATKNVTLSDEVFRDHFIGYPIMPASMLIEALAQAGTALLEVSCRFRRKALPVMIDQAKFRVFVRPGDCLKITVDVASQDETAVRLDGMIHIAETLAATAKLTFAFRDIDEFYPLHGRAVILSTYQYWLKDAVLVGAERPVL